MKGPLRWTGRASADRFPLQPPGAQSAGISREGRWSVSLGIKREVLRRNSKRRPKACDSVRRGLYQLRPCGHFTSQLSRLAENY